MDELREMLKALKHSNEMIAAKLDALTDRVDQGFSEIKAETRRLRRHLVSVESDLDQTIDRVDRLDNH